MKWFEGDIPTAVNTAKTRGALFVVYVSGSDEMSKQMDSTWDDSAVSALCEAEGCVALKVQSSSETCLQFSAIYPVVVIPCTYFINGGNGVPLEVTAGFVEAAAFVDKIRAVSKNHRAQVAASQASTSTVEQTSTPAPVEESSVATEQAANAEQSPAPCQMIPATSTPSPSAAAESSGIDDKVERAKELIAQKREEKARKEAEQAKNKEKDRRELGKQLGKLKDWKEEMKRKEEASEWKKDREEAKKARERVREQLARDRVERAAKFQKEKVERLQAEQPKETTAAGSGHAATNQAGDRMQRARLQFRFPDGSSLVHDFASSDTLQSACDFLRGETGKRNFSLKTTFPKRQFTVADMSQTLLDLQLAPSAAMLVLPGSEVVATTSPEAGGGGLLWSLLAPFLAVWNFLYMLVFGSPRSGGAPDGSTPQASTSTTSEGSQSSPQMPQHQQHRAARPKSSYGIRSRQEGNVHRFSADDDDDEDMSTWNGNSTQQL